VKEKVTKYRHKIGAFEIYCKVKFKAGEMDTPVTLLTRIVNLRVFFVTNKFFRREIKTIIETINTLIFKRGEWRNIVGIEVTSRPIQENLELTLK